MENRDSGVMEKGGRECCIGKPSGSVYMHVMDEGKWELYYRREGGREGESGGKTGNGRSEEGRKI